MPDAGLLKDKLGSFFLISSPAGRSGHAEPCHNPFPNPAELSKPLYNLTS